MVIALTFTQRALHDPVEFLRVLCVAGCAAALIAAGEVLPF